MFYLFVAYLVLSYLFILGIILGEVTIQIKPSRFHLMFFILAPISTPIAMGYMLVHLMNPGAPKMPDTSTQKKPE
jgi:hypothetical protein